MVVDITAEKLKGKISRGDTFVLLDVRDTPEFLKERLPGAVHMLISDMNKESIRIFDKKVPIITYSEDFDCPASRIAAEKLEDLGFSTFNYQGSFEDWKQKGFETDKEILKKSRVS